MFAKGWGGLGPKAETLSGSRKLQRQRKPRRRRHVRDRGGRIGGQKVSRQEGSGDVAKVRIVYELALVTIGSWPSTTLLLVCGLDRPQGGRVRRIHQTARELRTAISDVFRYAIATARPRAAIVSPNAFGGLLRAIERYQGAPETIAALELLALTFVRPRELRAAEWTEFDLDAAVWEIPLERMKMSRPHRVPAVRALAILRTSKVDGAGSFLFPSVRSVARSMSESTLRVRSP